MAKVELRNCVALLGIGESWGKEFVRASYCSFSSSMAEKWMVSTIFVIVFSGLDKIRNEFLTWPAFQATLAPQATGFRHRGGKDSIDDKYRHHPAFCCLGAFTEPTICRQ